MEEETGSFVKYSSIPFCDHLKIIPPTPTLLYYSASHLAALSEQVSSHTLHQTHLPSCGMSTVCSACAPVLFWQGLLDGWLSLEDGDISV